MRKRISRKRRKEVQKLGAAVSSERWLGESKCRRKDCVYCVCANYRGWSIYSAGSDELDAYKGVLEAMKDCDEMGDWHEESAVSAAAES